MKFELKMTENSASVVLSADHPFEVQTLDRLKKHLPDIHAYVIIKEHDGMYHREEPVGAQIVLDFIPEQKRVDKVDFPSEPPPGYVWGENNMLVPTKNCE